MLMICLMAVNQPGKSWFAKALRMKIAIVLNVLT